MKKIYYLLTAISAALFIYSSVNLIRHLGNPPELKLNLLQGFEETKTNEQYDKLQKNFSGKIASYNEASKTNQTIYFLLTFAVTLLTAASTLIATINATLKSNEANPKRDQTFSILIAVLTFLSTIINSLAGHYNDAKTEASKNATETVNLRNQFFTDYKAAADSTKSLVMQTYGQRLQ